MHAGEILSTHLQRKKFLLSCRKNVPQPKVSEIINEYLDEDTNNYNEIRSNLS